MSNTNCTTIVKTPVREPIKLNDRTIGWVEDGIFYKRAASSKHQLRKPPAWCIDAETFEQVIRLKAVAIVVTDKETELEYRCSVENFDRLKGELDRGFGRQYFLMLSHWEVRGNGDKQLSLWEGGDSNG